MPVNARRCHGNFGTLSLFLCRIIKCHRARQSAPARRLPRWPLSAISGTPESKPAVVLDREGHRRGDTSLGLRYLGFCCGFCCVVAQVIPPCDLNFSFGWSRSSLRLASAKLPLTVHRAHTCRGMGRARSLSTLPKVAPHQGVFQAGRPSGSPRAD